MTATEVCPTCMGDACEEGCGECWYASVGPDSHKVCHRCRGAGVVPVESEQRRSSDGAA